MPKERAVELDAVTDQAFAVIDEQPQIELRSVQVRRRKGLKAFLQRRSSDIEGIDGVRLAALAGASTRVGAEVSRDAQNPLAALDEKALQRPGHMPAIFQRPHALTV